MTTRHIISTMAAAGLLGAFSTALSAGINPHPFRTGLFGITPGQTVRVSVLNAGHSSATGVRYLLPAVRIADAAGTTVFAQKVQKVREGTGAFVDYTPDPVAARTAGASVPGGSAIANRRLQVRADVEIDADDGSAIERGDVVLTLEVFDAATGATTFTMPFEAVAFNPQPEPPTPAQGLAPSARQ